MEKTNWIEKIKEAVRIAMNKKLRIYATYAGYPPIQYSFILENNFEFYVYRDSKRIILDSPKGKLSVDYTINDRDDLELRSLILSIKEYQENMAISEFEEFVSENSEVKTITDINSLDDDE